MENYYIVINGVEYLMPSSVANANQTLFANNSRVIGEKKYFCIELLGDEKNYQHVERICSQCVSSVGMIAMDGNDKYMDVFNKLGGRMRFLDEAAKLSVKKGDYKKASEKQILCMGLALSAYSDMMMEEEIVEQVHGIGK